MNRQIELIPEPEILTMDTSNIMCEVSLKYSIREELYNKMQDLPSMITPEIAVSVIMEYIFDMRYIATNELFYVVLLNNAKKCMGWSQISKGGSTSTIVEPSEVMRVAVLSGANSMILVHNHPSGYMKESKADIMLTRRLSESGKLLNVPIIDHLIIMPDGGFISFKSKNLI